MRQKWTNEEKEILKKTFWDCKGQINKIMIKFKTRTKPSIKTMLRDMHLRIRKRWTLMEEELLKQKFATLSHKELEAIFKTSFRNIEWKAYKIGLNRNKNHTLEKLNAECPESYYWAGFISADGCLYHSKKRKSITLSIELSEKDHEHLSKFASFVKSNLCIKNRTRTSLGAQRKYCSLKLTDYEVLTKFINKFGFKKCKTYNPSNIRKIKKMSKDMLFCFVIGLIDGDGSICKNGKTISLCCHKNWINNINFILKKGTGYSFSTKQYKNCAVFGIYKAQNCLAIKQKALSFNLPFLKRKWDRVIQT